MIGKPCSENIYVSIIPNLRNRPQNIAEGNKIGEHRGFCRGLPGQNILRVRNVDVSKRRGGVLEEVAVVSSLFGGLCVQGIDFLPVFLPRQIFVDQVANGRVLAFLGNELVEQDAAEERGNGEDGTFLYCQSR